MTAVRAVVFTDQNVNASVDLVSATLRLARESGRIKICGIATPQPDRFRRRLRRTAMDFTRAALFAATNPGLRFSHVRPRRLNLARLQNRFDIPVLVPPDGDLNGAAFRERLVNEVRPDIALTFYVGTIFRRPLLESFDQVINFHDSLLPQHRGVGATSFSIYRGDERTGFTFHRMTEAIDTGPILLQASFPVDDIMSLDEVIRRKTAAAVEQLPKVFELILARDPGRPQEGPSCYHSVRDVQSVRYIDDPRRETAAELNRVVRAFGTAFLNIEGVHYPVTRLRSAASGQRLAFRTADGRTLAPDRFRYLPRPLYELSRRFRIVAG